MPPCSRLTICHTGEHVNIWIYDKPDQLVVAGAQKFSAFRSRLTLSNTVFFRTTALPARKARLMTIRQRRIGHSQERRRTLSVSGSVSQGRRETALSVGFPRSVIFAVTLCHSETDTSIEHFHPQEPMVPQIDTDTRTYRNSFSIDTRPRRTGFDPDTWLYQNGISPDTWPYQGGFSPDSNPRLNGSVRSVPPQHRSGRARHRKPPPITMRRAAALTAIMLASGVAAAGFLDATGGHPVVTGAAELNAGAVTSMPQPGSADGAAAVLPEPVPVGPPAQAYLPRHAAASMKPAAPKKRAPSPARHSASPSPSPSVSLHSTSPSPSPSPSQPTTPTPSTTPTPTPSPTSPASGGGPCTDPSFTTSDDFGGENLGPYTVSNDMWNVGGGGISQTLSACSASSWFVNATVADDGGGVKTYPNSHLNFASPPAISSLSSITSTFASNSPGTGTFEDAYDIWLNGLAGAGGDEVMIWTDNNGQIPAGSPTTSVTFGGQSYTVWKGNNGPVSFVSNSNVTSGRLNLLQFFQWLISKGWEPANSSLEQVDYGVEIVSTNSMPETFGFSDFSVSSS
jgi:Glycosyl hydrolase family 12